MRQFHLKRKKGGFTLIELLIVIAIILILIAIALPNFLEAQIRARVTKAKGELRSLATALFSYQLDWKLYPNRGDSDYADPTVVRRQNGMRWLTSPIAYITSLPDDPFPQSFRPEGSVPLVGPPYGYTLTGVDEPPGASFLHPHGADLGVRAYMIMSAGPDSPETEPALNCIAFGPPSYSYSATNGTKSRGDIMLMGGEAQWMGLDITSRGCLADFEALKTQPFLGVDYDGKIYTRRFPDGLTLGS